jgi:hypothetical protein
MNWKTIFITVVLLFGPCSFAQVPPSANSEKQSSPNPVFSIAVAPAADPIRLGSPINVIVTVTNTSGKEIYWETEKSEDSVYKAFTVLLKKDGWEAETTFFHRKITGRNRRDDPPEIWSGSTIPVAHPPGKMFEMTIDLNRLYEITEPGAYTLDLSRFDEYSKTTVRSNSITLTIESKK